MACLVLGLNKALQVAWNAMNYYNGQELVWEAIPEVFCNPQIGARAIGVGLRSKIGPLLDGFELTESASPIAGIQDGSGSCLTWGEEIWEGLYIVTEEI